MAKRCNRPCLIRCEPTKKIKQLREQVLQRDQRQRRPRRLLQNKNWVALQEGTRIGKGTWLHVLQSNFFAAMYFFCSFVLLGVPGNASR